MQDRTAFNKRAFSTHARRILNTGGNRRGDRWWSRRETLGLGSWGETRGLDRFRMQFEDGANGICQLDVESGKRGTEDD